LGIASLPSWFPMRLGGWCSFALSSRLVRWYCTRQQGYHPHQASQSWHLNGSLSGNEPWCHITWRRRLIPCSALSLTPRSRFALNAWPVRASNLSKPRARHEFRETSLLLAYFSHKFSIRSSSSIFSVYFVPRLIILYCVLFLPERGGVSCSGISSKSNERALAQPLLPQANTKSVDIALRSVGLIKTFNHSWRHRKAV
jgi:hypothetical protein